MHGTSIVKAGRHLCERGPTQEPASSGIEVTPPESCTEGGIYDPTGGGPLRVELHLRQAAGHTRSGIVSFDFSKM